MIYRYEALTFIAANLHKSLAITENTPEAFEKSEMDWIFFFSGPQKINN